jgi:uncharacterized membrane protein YphA (DoxX/SURF4 family)
MKRIIFWVIAALLALAFVAAGLAKLTAQPMMVTEFHLFDFPLAFMYLIGSFELIAAALVLWPRVSTVGAGIITVIMLGALFEHFTHGQAPMTPPVFILLALALTLGWLRTSANVVPMRTAIPATS